MSYLFSFAAAGLLAWGIKKYCFDVRKEEGGMIGVSARERKVLAVEMKRKENAEALTNEVIEHQLDNMKPVEGIVTKPDEVDVGGVGGGDVGEVEEMGSGVVGVKEEGEGDVVEGREEVKKVAQEFVNGILDDVIAEFESKKSGDAVFTDIPELLEK